MHCNNGQRIGNDGERVFIHENTAICLGCRTQMTEMTLARVFQKSLYIKLSLDPRFAPVDVALVDICADVSLRVGDVVVINGYPDPRIMDHRWEYIFTGVAIEHTHYTGASRQSTNDIIEAIQSVCTNNQSVLGFETSAELQIIRLFIENTVRAIEYSVIANPSQYSYQFTKRSKEVESGRLVYTCARIANCHRVIGVIYQETKDTPWIVERFRALSIPVILCGEFDSITADDYLSIEEDLLIDLLINDSTTTNEPMNMPPSPAPSAK